MTAASCDKLVRAICTGDSSEIDSVSLSRLSSDDVCKLRALTLEDDNIKYATEGMWGTLLALNLLLNSQDDERKVRSRCGDKLSIFMLSLICCRVDISRLLLKTFNITLAVRTEKGLSTLDLAPPGLKTDLLKLLDLELQGALSRKPEPTADNSGHMTRYSSARDLGHKAPPLGMPRTATQPDLSHHIAAGNDLSNNSVNRKAPSIDPRLAEMTAPGPLTREQIDRLSLGSTVDLLYTGLRDLEKYVVEERGRLAKEKQIKAMEMMAGTLKDTEAGLEAAHAVAEARSGAPQPRVFNPLERVVHRRSLRPRAAPTLNLAK